MTIALLVLIYLYLGYCSAVAVCRQIPEVTSATAKRIGIAMHIIAWPLFVLASLPVTIFELIYKRY